MKNFLIALIPTALCFGTLHAQQLPGEASFGSMSQALSALPEQAKITVISGYAGTGKAGSNANVIQTGNQNILNLNLTGNGNNVLTQQLGDGNVLNVDLNATNSQYILTQDGNRNNLQMYNVSTSGVDFRVNQKNNGNSLTLDGGIMPLESMKIEQSGGMQVIIESNALIGRP